MFRERERKKKKKKKTIVEFITKYLFFSLIGLTTTLFSHLQGKGKAPPPLGKKKKKKKRKR